MALSYLLLKIVNFDGLDLAPVYQKKLIIVSLTLWTVALATGTGPLTKRGDISVTPLPCIVDVQWSKRQRLHGSSYYRNYGQRALSKLRNRISSFLY